MKCLLLLFLLSVFLIGVAPLCADSGSIGSKDTDEIKLLCFTDPCYPTPQIGAREFSVTLDKQAAWDEPKIYLQHANNTDAILKNPFGGSSAFTLVDVGTITDSGAGTISTSYTLPTKVPDRVAERAGLTSNDDAYSDGSTVYYRWVVRHSEGTTPVTLIGSLHFFEVPRRLVFAAMGDSYMSGQGAFREGAETIEDAWITEFNGISANRSPDSGLELSMYQFYIDNPSIAFDYFNTSSAGAIMTDVYSDTSQYDRAGGETSGKGCREPQLDNLRRWTEGRRNYEVVDAMILSVGGNDFGFPRLVKQYLGIDSIDCIAGYIQQFDSIAEISDLVWAYILIDCLVIGHDAAYSFRDGWGSPGHYESDGQRWQFSEYRDALDGRYEDFAEAVFDSEYFDVKNALIVEYPNLLFGHTGGHSELGGVLEIDYGEVAEIRKHIARSSAIDDPSPTNQVSGINHRILDIAEDNITPYGVNVVGVETATYMDADYALPQRKSDRRFNTIWDALRRNREPGRKFGDIGAAMHPNQAGQRDLIKPSIDAKLGSTITASYRENCAAAEGIDKTRVFDYNSSGILFLTIPGELLTAPGDIVLGMERLTMKQVNPGDIELGITLSNDDVSVFPATEIRAELFERLEIPQPPGQALEPPLRRAAEFLIGTLPPINPNGSVNVDLSAALPGTLDFDKLPLRTLMPPGFNSALYAPRDAFLASLFPSRYLVRIKFVLPGSGVELAAMEPFAEDSPGEAWIDVAPVIFPAEEGVMLDALAAHLGLASISRAQIDASMLVNPQFLSFFGIVEPASILESAPSLGREGLLAVLNWEEDAPMQSVIPSGLRLPRDLFVQLENNPGLGGSIYNRDDNHSIAYELPADGRPRTMKMSYMLLGNFIEETFTVGGSLPSVPHLVSPVESTELVGRMPVFRIAGASGFGSYRLRASRAAYGAEIFDSGLRDLASGAEEDLTVGRMPRDGGKVFVMLDGIRDDGEIHSELYVFDTAPFNARLVDAIDRKLDSDSETFEWIPRGTAQAYRVTIGSLPGHDDVTPMTVVPAATSLITIDSLPGDARLLFLRLETQRGGAWDGEDYLVEAASLGRGGLITPHPEAVLHPQQKFIVSPAGAEVTGFQLTLRDSPGGTPVYDSGMIPGAEPPGLDVTIPTATAAGDFLYGSLVTQTASGSSVERWRFERPYHATITSPDSADQIPAATPVAVAWSVSDPTANYLLLVGTEPGVADIFNTSYSAGTAGGSVLVPASWIDTAVYITLVEQASGGNSQSVVAVVITNPAAADYAIDDLPDRWQVEQFGIGNPDGLAAADADGDGQTNGEEYLFGSDPNDAISMGSIAQLLDPSAAPSFTFELLDRTKACIESSSDLELWEEQPSESELLPSGERSFKLVTPTTDVSRLFYRITLRRVTD